MKSLLSEHLFVMVTLAVWPLEARSATYIVHGSHAVVVYLLSMAL